MTKLLAFVAFGAVFLHAVEGVAQVEFQVMKKVMDVSLLTRACESSRDVDRGVCTGYVMGIVDRAVQFSILSREFDSGCEVERGAEAGVLDVVDA
jgi:hypothetical protein